ncbi:hypothetical protein WJX84_007768 [Apatococcus fuscideae]|uniref:Uncharacterized protein n=1 Tax=Apatococcus fuscideae TaxID=2026836 RepID=A0AAW1TII5_9CHLO
MQAGEGHVGVGAVCGSTIICRSSTRSSGPQNKSLVTDITISGVNICATARRLRGGRAKKNLLAMQCAVANQQGLPEKNLATEAVKQEQEHVQSNT